MALATNWLICSSMKLSAEIITTISSERHANLQGREEEEVSVPRSTRLCNGCRTACIQRLHTWGSSVWSGENTCRRRNCCHPRDPHHQQRNSRTVARTEHQQSSNRLAHIFSHPIYSHFNSECFVHPKSPRGDQVNRARQVLPRQPAC